MELPAGERDDFIKALSESEGKGEDAAGMTIFADTVTSIFITKPGKGEKVVTIALMDSEEAKVLSDNEAIEKEAEEASKGVGHKIFQTYFNPVGRMSRRSYIPKMLGAAIPAAILFGFTCFRPELFVGDLNVYIFTFLVVGTLCFISLISLAMRRLSDIGLSHLYYWVFFLLLLPSTRWAASSWEASSWLPGWWPSYSWLPWFFWPFSPEKTRKTSTALCRKSDDFMIGRSADFPFPGISVSFFSQ